MIKASYTAEGTRGLLKDGGTGRRDAVEALVTSRGGTLKGFYYAFGDDDLYIIAELPTNADLAAVSLAINSTAGAKVKANTLLDRRRDRRGGAEGGPLPPAGHLSRPTGS